MGEPRPHITNVLPSVKIFKQLIERRNLLFEEKELLKNSGFLNCCQDCQMLNLSYADIKFVQAVPVNVVKSELIVLLQVQVKTSLLYPVIQIAEVLKLSLKRMEICNKECRLRLDNKSKYIRILWELGKLMNEVPPLKWVDKFAIFRLDLETGKVFEENLELHNVQPVLGKNNKLITWEEFWQVED